MDPNIASLLHFVVPGLGVVAVFMLIMLVIGEEKPPPDRPTQEDLLRAENKELRKRRALDDWR